MSDRPLGGTGEDRFDAIDARLNVFALANGMDLTKDADFRRLEWFTEGLERGILIEAGDDGAFRVHVLSWPSGSAEIRGRASLGDGLSEAELAGLLPSAIDAANEL